MLTNPHVQIVGGSVCVEAEIAHMDERRLSPSFSTEGTVPATTICPQPTATQYFRTPLERVSP
jgi:hypothetical protein